MTEKKPSLFLRNCKICKHDVAWNAKKCLNCGVANPTTTWKHNLIAFVLVMLAVGYCATPSDKATTAETKTANSGQSSSIEAPDESTPVSNITEDSTAINEEENQPLSFEEYAMGYAMQICETYIKTLLLAPRSADFAFLDRRGSQDGEIVTVNSYVEAQNMYGAKVQSDFVCKIRFIDKNMDNPNLEELTFSNQSILK